MHNRFSHAFSYTFVFHTMRLESIDKKIRPHRSIVQIYFRSKKCTHVMNLNSMIRELRNVMLSKMSKFAQISVERVI